ncbi:hypothetical protein A2Y85_05625 [candidate division WOR-3 bacterium RBG_13_43_14]|uniref:Peptidase S8/S53 domain-containing protein n=1 Tax=candidate division WOR-3 bacterium RBG_13_43_14 TaxID=1802590 RepID=A0A1F4UF83_UNCW3|nr:MAG: hypothetical protein A2Y85_05625 [candidate division WOR-3 bacterium RBG_13_43_14]
MKKSMIILCALAFIAQAGVVHQQLQERLTDLPQGEKLQVIVHMKEQADLSLMPTAAKAEKLQHLQDFSQNSQHDLAQYLESLGERINNYQSYWIFNGMTFSTTRDIIETVAARNDVDYVIDDFVIQLEYNKGEEVAPLAPTWAITLISAHLCWNDGFTGSGVIVGNMDTGVEVTHSAFGGRWITGGWYDAVNGQSAPYDDHGHGTHTMGSICGGDGNGSFDPDIGVAPGANFICAKCFDAGGSGQATWIHNSFQWFAGQSAQVVGNSWGNNNQTTLEFWADCANWRDLGIVPVFSIGNAGSGSGTAGTPGNFPTVTGVGAVDSGDNIASFSSRGPAPNQSPWTDTQYWERPDWNRTKPDISAPGVNVNSAAPGGGYQTMSGTSMASPHVTGAVALLLEKNPILDYNTIYNILLDNADHPSQGAPYPNNNYGWGRLNCYAALNAVPVGNMPNVVLRLTSVVNDNNGNGKLDPGENGGIVNLIKNTGNLPATNIQGRLRTSSSYITITDSTYGFGTLNAGDSTNNASDPFDVNVNASTPPGTVADFQLVLAAAETTWIRPFSLTIGMAPGTIVWGPKQTSYSNTSRFFYGVAYDRVGDRIYICDGYGRNLFVLSSDSFVTSLGTTPAPDTCMSGIEYSAFDNRLWVTGWNQKQLWKINKTTGAVLRQFPNPAVDYPIGIAMHNEEMWCVDRRGALGATQYIYVGDTLENFTQYTNPIQGYYNSRCLAYDEVGGTYLMTHTWFNAAGTAVDSVGIVEYGGEPPVLTGRRMLLNPGWNLRGIEYDPRDGNYWITIPEITAGAPHENQVVKVRGFYPPLGAGEQKSASPRLFNLMIYPNPAGSIVLMNLSIPYASHVAIQAFDVSGRFINNIYDGNIMNGSHTLTWNLKDSNNRDIADGVYFIVLETSNDHITQKIIVTR